MSYVEAKRIVSTFALEEKLSKGDLNTNLTGKLYLRQSD